jgi:hypothetical protein
MCERWFQNRLQSIRDGRAKPYSSSAWKKNLRYEKDTKAFYTNWKVIGEDFLMGSCNVRTM